MFVRAAAYVPRRRSGRTAERRTHSRASWQGSSGRAAQHAQSQRGPQAPALPCRALPCPAVPRRPPVVQLLQLWVHGVGEALLLEEAAHRHVVRCRKLPGRAHHARRQRAARDQPPAAPVRRKACGRARGASSATRSVELTRAPRCCVLAREQQCAACMRCAGVLSPGRPPRRLRLTLQEDAWPGGGHHQPLPGKAHRLHGPHGRRPRLARGCTRRAHREAGRQAGGRVGGEACEREQRQAVRWRRGAGGAPALAAQWLPASHPAPPAPPRNTVTPRASAAWMAATEEGSTRLRLSSSVPSWAAWRQEKHRRGRACTLAWPVCAYRWPCKRPPAHHPRQSPARRPTAPHHVQSKQLRLGPRAPLLDALRLAAAGSAAAGCRRGRGPALWRMHRRACTHSRCRSRA